MDSEKSAPPTTIGPPDSPLAPADWVSAGDIGSLPPPQAVSPRIEAASSATADVVRFMRGSLRGRAGGPWSDGWAGSCVRAVVNRGAARFFQYAAFVIVS